MMFCQYPDLLKRLIATLLRIRYESIEQFVITNPEMMPEVVGDKFCRLDINMMVDGQRVDLELQISNEGDYPERSLYYWAREYSTALKEGDEYKDLPCTIIISIVAFKLFSCEEFHSEFQPLEVTRYTPLTDKQVLHYFELPKLPKAINAGDELRLWLKLVDAETEEELQQIEALGVPLMEQAIGAYRHISATEEFKEIERMRSRTRHNEASALGNARREGITQGITQGAEQERSKWESVVADKEAEIARLRAILDEK